MSLPFSSDTGGHPSVLGGWMPPAGLMAEPFARLIVASTARDLALVLEAHRTADRPALRAWFATWLAGYLDIVRTQDRDWAVTFVCISLIRQPENAPPRPGESSPDVDAGSTGLFPRAPQSWVEMPLSELLTFAIAELGGTEFVSFNPNPRGSAQ